MAADQTLNSFDNFNGFLSEVIGPFLVLSGNREMPIQPSIIDDEVPFVEVKEPINHTMAIPWAGYGHSTSVNFPQFPHTLVSSYYAGRALNVTGQDEAVSRIERVFLAQPGSLGYRLMSPDAVARETDMDAERVRRIVHSNPKRFRKSSLSLVFQQPLYALRSFPVHWKERWALFRWYMELPFGWGIRK